MGCRSAEAPTVSIIMSVYNGEIYLKESIESALTQTFSDFEFIIINDGSTDKTEEIIKSYNDKRIVYITNESNIGLTKSLNKGLMLARGKYIARMDADDTSLPQRLENQVNFLEKQPDVGLLGTAYYEVNSENKIVGIKTLPVANDELKKKLIKYNPFMHASVMMRKAVLDTVGYYDERLPSSIQDYELWFRMARYSKLANLSKPLAVRKYDGQNISSRKEKQLYWNALKIRLGVIIINRQYPLWAFVYLFRPLVMCVTPAPLIKLVRKYFLKRKIY